MKRKIHATILVIPIHRTDTKELFFLLNESRWDRGATQSSCDLGTSVSGDHNVWDITSEYPECEKRQ